MPLRRSLLLRSPRQRSPPSPRLLPRQRLPRSADPAPVAEENGTTEDDEDGGEAQEGETAADRPDSPDDVDEAAGETSEPEAPADS